MCILYIIHEYNLHTWQRPLSFSVSVASVSWTTASILQPLNYIVHPFGRNDSVYRDNSRYLQIRRLLQRILGWTVVREGKGSDRGLGY